MIAGARPISRLLAAAIALAAFSLSCSRQAPYTIRTDVGQAAADARRADDAGGAVDAPVRILIFGDYGDPGAQQRAVTDMMLEAHRREPFDAAVSLGDNVYDCGLDVTIPGAAACRFDHTGNAVDPGYEAPNDPRFREQFERPLLPFAEGPRPLEIFGVLGNHDVASHLRCREGRLRAPLLARTRACLQVAQRSPVWRMPGRHYVVDRGPARLVIIDSNLLKGDYGGFSLDGEVAFVREAVRGAAGRHVFVMAHHPAATAGVHRDDFDARYRERLRHVIEAGDGGIAAWFAGHDHVLQHTSTPDGLDVFVSGNAARGRPEERFEELAPRGAKLHFGSTEWGFAVLEVRRSGWSVAFESGSTPLHCCRANVDGAGPCQPVACPSREAPVGVRTIPDLP